MKSIPSFNHEKKVIDLTIKEEPNSAIIDFTGDRDDRREVRKKKTKRTQRKHDDVFLIDMEGLIFDIFIRLF